MKRFFLRITTLATMPFLGMFLAMNANAATPYPDLVTCSGSQCNWCHVFEMIQRVFDTAVYIMFPLVVIFIMYSAITYIIGSASGGEESISKARATLTDAIIGLIIMLLTFVIVNATIVGITGAKVEDFINIDCSKVNTTPPGQEEQFGPPLPPS